MSFVPRLRLGVAAGAMGIAGFAGAGVPAVSAAATGAAITIHEGPPGCSTPSYCFAPSAVTVNAGATVTWTDGSDSPHTVTRCTPSACSGAGGGTGSGTGPASAQFGQGQKYTAAFIGTGTYLYYCTVHGYSVMHGTVTVVSASSAVPAAPKTGAAPPLTLATLLVAGGMTTTALGIRRRRTR